MEDEKDEKKDICVNPHPDFDFKKPDYASVALKRSQNLVKIRKDPKLLQACKQVYKDNPAQFIMDWGCTYDPRNVDIGLPANIPFILFTRQQEWIKWVMDNWRNRQDAVAEKSRDMGLSWLSVGIAATIWLFHPGVTIGFGSRKEEYVDKLDDPKSLLWKFRQFVQLLPKEFRPVKWDAPFMRIINHDNGSYILGEAGQNIGRGNRTSIYFLDEASFIERQDLVDAALSQTSNCKIYLSTANGNSNPFYQKRHSGKYPVFTFHWKDDPRKSYEWYQKQCSFLDPVIVAQEIDIDYNASTSDSWIDGNLVEMAQGVKTSEVEKTGPLQIGIDAAHFGDDVSVITLRQGRAVLWQKGFSQIDGHDLAGIVMDECRKIKRAEVEQICIELDGPGVSCYDVLNNSIYSDVIIGVHTGVKQKDGRNFNLRAKMYRELREWLEDGPVSLPNDRNLKSQLCSVSYGYKNGLLLLQSKKDMRKDHIKSPDFADSLALTFAKPISYKRRKVVNLTEAKNYYRN